MSKEPVNLNKIKLSNISEFLSDFDSLGNLEKARIEDIDSLYDQWSPAIEQYVKEEPSLEDHELINNFRIIQKKRDALYAFINQEREELYRSLNLQTNQSFGFLTVKNIAQNNIRSSWGELNSLQKIRIAADSIPEAIQQSKKVLGVKDEGLFNLAKNSESFTVQLSDLQALNSPSFEVVTTKIKEDLDSMFGGKLTEKVPKKVFQKFLSGQNDSQLLSKLGVNYDRMTIVAVTVGINESNLSIGNYNDDITPSADIVRDYTDADFKIDSKSETIKTLFEEKIHFIDNHEPAKVKAKIFINITHIKLFV